MSRTPIAMIRGIGMAVPDRVMTNAEFEKILDTSDQWILERTGIRERRIAGPETALTQLCEQACRDALAQAGLSVTDVEAIVLGTV
ncbi:MAG: 3-oxoacyl-ACP synthase, partial [Gemmatimonadales bacterium]